ncbi:hypothetical protein GCM10009547_06750 [Sporichthya brevicatena]|uniref:DUF2795 domain-containing protein n=1 Tax=Sporichthya brevicatena TaxID=171442 RepID=A0ABN1GAI5_9ACTN
MQSRPTSAAVREALNAADFPASKDRLVECAQTAGAEIEVVRTLRALPAERFASADDVLHAVERL